LYNASKPTWAWATNTDKNNTKTKTLQVTETVLIWQQKHAKTDKLLTAQLLIQYVSRLN